MNVGDIAKVSFVPRPKIYGIIKGLITKGLCIEKPGNIKGYSAVSPRIVSQRLLQNYQEQLKLKKEYANKFVDIYTAIFDEGRSKSDSLEYIEILKNQKTITERFNQLTRNLKREALSFTKAPYAIPFVNRNPEGIKALKRGVVIKCIYEKHESLSKNLLENIIIPFAKAGEEARVIDKLPMKIHIFDRKIVFMTLNDPVTLKPSFTRIIIAHNDFAAFLETAFYSKWEEAQPVEDFLKEHYK
jgi:sugar-specific transcriptional regulator TrmB